MKRGDIVSWNLRGKSYCGKIVCFVPQDQDAFDFREYFSEVPDSRCNFNFVESYNRVIVLTPFGKNGNLFAAYAPCVYNVTPQDSLKNYRISGNINGKQLSREYFAANIIDAIQAAGSDGYENIYRVEQMAHVETE